MHLQNLVKFYHFFKILSGIQILMDGIMEWKNDRQTDRGKKWRITQIQYSPIFSKQDNNKQYMYENEELMVADAFS